MQFQLKYKNAEVISIETLDKMASEFWGQEIDPQYYAKPKSGIDQNWFDIIGWSIALYPNKNEEIGLDTISAYMIFTQSKWGGDRFSPNYFKLWVDTLSPYIELCHHWHTMGIVAISL